MMHFRDTYTIPNNDPLMGPFDYVVYNVVYTLYYYVTLVFNGDDGPVIKRHVITYYLYR